MEKNFLKQLREAKGFTQEEVSDRLGVAPNTIQNWERDLKFKRPEDLHALLDLYGVSDVMRNGVVLDVYGRKGKDDTSVIMEKPQECVVFKEAAERLEGEKDVAYYSPYPLDKICTCLEIVDGRIRCLETAIEYVKTHYFSKKSKIISGWETAILIDVIGREYGVEIGATKSYQIQEINMKVDAVFPYGDDDDWRVDSEEFGREMDCEEYLDALCEKLEGEGSPVEEQKEALGKMQVDVLELSEMRKLILAFICQRGCWEKAVEVSGLLDVTGGTFWEIVTILRTGKSYKKTSTLRRMEWFLAPEREHLISIDRRAKMRKSSLMEIYCDAAYQPQATVQMVLRVLDCALDVMPTGYTILDVGEWEDMCRNSTVLKERLMQYK